MTRPLRFVLFLGCVILFFAPLAAAVETEVTTGDSPTTTEQDTEQQGQTSQCSSCPTTLAGTTLTINANGSLVANTDDKKVIVDLGFDFWIKAFAWDPSNNYAIIVGEKGTIVKLTIDGQITMIPSGTPENLWLVSWKPSGSQVSSGSGSSGIGMATTLVTNYALVLGQNGTVLKWDGERIINIMESSGSSLNSLEWSSDGDYAIIKGGDGKVFRYPPEMDQSPFLVINEPIDGTIVTNVVKVCGVAMDPDGKVFKVEVRIDGGSWFTADGTSKWSRQIPVSELQNGAHTIYARAYDGTVYSSPVKVLIDVENDQPPTLDILYPITGQSVPDRVRITGTAQDPEGQLDSVWIKIDDNPWTKTIGTQAWGADFDPLDYGPGVHIISARAYDGIQYSDINYITVFVGDRTNDPYAIILSPIDGRTYTTSEDIRLEAIADEFVSDRLTFSWRSNIDGVIGTGDIISKKLSVGHHKLTVTVSDDDKEASDIVFIDVVDTTDNAPSVVFITPKEDSKVAGKVTITGGAQDDQKVVAVKVKVDGGPWTTIKGSNIWYFVYDTTQTQDGPHVITAMAFDGRSWSQPVNLKVRVSNHKVTKVTLGPAEPKDPTRLVDGPTTGKVDSKAISTVALVASMFTFALIIALVESFKVKFLSIFFVPFYCRISKDEVLDNFTRGAIYGFIVANPGAHYNLIKQELRLNNGAIIYHLDILERKGYVSAEKAGIFKKYYPKGFKKEGGILEMLTDIQRRIFHEIEANPGVSQKDIASNMNITARALNYHIKTLLKAQLIMLERVGRRTLCFINSTAGSSTGAGDAQQT